jgi:membrane complex biogenesis BtpA family protein
MIWTKDLFKTEKPAIGMVHILPLPTSPRFDPVGGMDKIVASALADLTALQDGGIDAVMFCNEHDRPYTLKSNHAVVASMGFVIGVLRQHIRIPFGVDILWDPVAALSVAKATGGSFVREIFTGVYASDMGIWNTNAGEALRYRTYIHAEDIRVLYNINAEFAAPLAMRPIEDVAKSVVFSSLPDGICVSGPMTGHSVRKEQLESVRKVIQPVPVFINTGAKKENIAELIGSADGVIVGSSLKFDGNTWNPVDQSRVEAFMAALRASRQ